MGYQAEPWSAETVAATGKRGKLEMLSEFLREAAVLVLVFVPLDMLTRGGFSAWRVIVVILFSAVILAFGIIIERMRPRTN